MFYVYLCTCLVGLSIAGLGACIDSAIGPTGRPERNVGERIMTAGAAVFWVTLIVGFGHGAAWAIFQVASGKL